MNCVIQEAKLEDHNKSLLVYEMKLNETDKKQSKAFGEDALGESGKTKKLGPKASYTMWAKHAYGKGQAWEVRVFKR